MLSQLTLRIQKKLIEVLKNLDGHENTSVNALAEHFLDAALKTAAQEGGYRQLIACPYAALQQMCRKIMLGQTLVLAQVWPVRRFINARRY